MNLLWIAALAIFVGMEKLATRLTWLPPVSAIALILGGLALVLT